MTSVNDGEYSGLTEPAPPQTGPGRTRSALATLIGSVSNTTIVAIQAVVLVPLYLHALGSHLYGAWLATGDVLLWLQAFDLGLPNFLIQRVGAAHANRDDRTASDYLFAGVIVLGAVAAIVAFILFAAAPTLARIVRVPESDTTTFLTCFRIAGIAASLSILNNAIVGYSRGVQETAFLASSTAIGGLLGMVVSLIAVLNGFGLWAIVAGVVVRSLISLGASGIFLVKRLQTGLLRGMRWRSQYFVEIARISPATAAGGIGYALSGQSENAIIGVVIGPAAVPVFALTKKLVDLMRSILDSIAFATYGGFAHLVASKERETATWTLAKIITVRFCLAAIGAALYVCVNRSVVAAWVGPKYFGGQLLTMLLAMQFIVTGDHFLVNYLYRACGAVRDGSALLAAEAVLRVPLILVGVSVMGFVGIPLAATLSATAFRIFTYRRLASYLSLEAVRLPQFPSARQVTIAFLLLCAGVLAGSSLYFPNWPVITLVSLISVAVSSASLLLAVPILRTTLSEIRHAL